jgi:exodeoxyribonuclease VII small subunit
MAQKKLSYRESINEIEEILSSIENEEPDVDILSEKVKRVTYLLKYCRNKIYKTKDEVDNVLKNIEEER